MFTQYIDSPSPVLCIRDAVLTESPKRQYRGVLVPTTPPIQEPGKNAKGIYERYFVVIIREKKKSSMINHVYLTPYILAAYEVFL